MARVAIGLAVNAGFWWQRRHPGGFDQRHDDHKQDVETDKQQARQQGAGVHVADRAAQLVGQHNQHQGGRDGLCQSARRCDGAGGDGSVIAVAQHDGQRDQPHGNHGGCHHPGGGSQQGTDQNHGNGQATAQRPKDLTHGFKQVLGHARALQNNPHEGEKRDGQQCVVLHDAENPQRQRLEQRRRKNSGFHADEAKTQAGRGQGKGHRESGQQAGEQAAKHERHKLLRQKGGFHLFSFCQFARDDGFEFFQMLFFVGFIFFMRQHIGPVANQECDALDQL